MDSFIWPLDPVERQVVRVVGVVRRRAVRLVERRPHQRDQVVAVEQPVGVLEPVRLHVRVLQHDPLHLPRPQVRRRDQGQRVPPRCGVRPLELLRDVVRQRQYFFDTGS